MEKGKNFMLKVGGGGGGGDWGPFKVEIDNSKKNRYFRLNTNTTLKITA